MREHVLWVEKYRPNKIDDCILPEALKKTFKEIINQSTVPNMLLSGGAGIGKTTVAKAIAAELHCDCMVINASESGNIDTLRTTIRNFSSTISLQGGRKILILDEADYLNPQSTQPALRNFMEEFASNTAFVLTCNFKNKILEPLRSRCSVIDFRIENKEKPKLAVQFLKRVKTILETEKIKYTDPVVVALVQKYFPDFRKTLNELQRYSMGGTIDEGILVQLSEIKISELMKYLKSKDFDKVRKWVVNNLDNDPTRIFRAVYDVLAEHISDNTLPIAILKTADYQYKAAFVADHEINLLAYLIELMVEVEFK